jgi:hypothetical protein
MADVPRSRAPWMIGLAAVLLILIVAGAVGGRMYVDGKTRGVVASPKDGEKLRGAVGLVLQFLSVTRADGTEVELLVSTGSSFCVSSEQGIFITNRHVVAESDEIKSVRSILATRNVLKLNVELQNFVNRLTGRLPVKETSLKIRIALDGVPGTAEDATVLRQSGRFDMAIIKLAKPITKLPKFILREDLPASTTEVYAVGYPGIANEAKDAEKILQYLKQQKLDRAENQLLDKNFNHSVSRGVVNRVYKDGNGIELIDHDAKIARGNSGGPLIDDQGRVVGINTFYFARDSESQYVAPAVGQMREEMERVVGENVIRWEKGSR